MAAITSGLCIICRFLPRLKSWASASYLCDSTPSSDFDLAVKFADELSERDRFEKRCFLSGALQHEDYPFIDVSDIESLPLAVAHDAVNGELLCGDERAFERFKADIEAEFDEQRETLRRHQRAVIDRIAEDGLQR